jgi:hypothetical protein
VQVLATLLLKNSFYILLILLININAFSQEEKKNIKTLEVNLENIEKIINIDPQNVDLLSIYALRLVTKNRIHDAINIYKKILLLRPDLDIIYLELAKLQFLIRDFKNSEENFLYIYNKKISRDINYNIRNYLKLIKKNKDKDINFNIRVGKNDNINNGTYADTIDLFGVPFKINDNAKAKESYEFLTNINGRSNFYLRNNKILSGFEISHSDFKQSEYDRLKLSYNIGPEFVITNKTRSNLQFNYSKELLEGKNSVLDNSVSFNILNQLNSDLSISNKFSIGEIDYYNNSNYNSDIYYFQTNINKIYKRFNTNLNLKYSDIDANQNIYGNVKKKIQLDVSTYISKGIFVDLAIGKEFSGYNQYQPIFSNTRKDKLEFYSIDLWSDRFYFNKYYPKLNFTTRDNKSNINVYKTSSKNFSLYLVKDF